MTDAECMTEEQWLAFGNVNDLPEFLRQRASRRKLLLFACAQERQVRVATSPHLCHLTSTDPRFSQVEFMERYADGLANEQERLVVLRGLFAVKDEALPDLDFEKIALARHVAEFVECGKDDPRQVSSGNPDEVPVQYHEVHQDGLQRLLSRTCQGPASLIHDIFGNPFKPVAVDLCWDTSIVKALATAIYEERAFDDRLPILADALEEAGCSDAAILHHCRQPGEHWRGCWVVDLLLGKT